MSTAQILSKLNAYKKNPQVFQPLTTEEMADLVILVLSQVREIEKAIETKRLDIDSKFSRKTEESISKLERDNKTLLTELTNKVNGLITQSDAVLNETASQLETRVQQAIENIRNGENGIVTEEEIERAASIAYSMMELPDFDELVMNQITSNGEAIRNALELLQGDARYKVEINDVQGLEKALNDLAQIRSTQGGTIGKNQVYNFIRQAIADGTISSGGSVSDEAYGGSWDGVTDVAPSKNAVYDKIQALVLGSGTGDVVGPASAVDSNIAAFDTTTGKLIKDGGATIAQVRDRSTHTGTQTASTISDFDTEVSNNTDVAANTAARHAAVTVTDSAEIDFTLTGQNITASLVAGSIDETKLDASVNASLDLADSASQPGHTHTESDITDLKNYEIKAIANGSLTAVNDTFYVCVSNSTFTDPSPVEGEGFAVFVRNGTATVGGTGYSTAGTIVHRIYHSGAWSNYVYLNSAQLATTYQPLDADLTVIAGLVDPNADRILFWDDSAGAYAYLTASTGLTISGTNMTVRTSSATQTGIVELATDAETVTGTDTARATTPANITARLAAPGTIGGTTPGAATFTTVTTTGNIELGHASDTTISRTGAGAIAVEGVAIPTISSTSTLTNKTLTAPKLTVSNLSNLGATETIDWSAADIFYGTLDSNVNITHSNEASGRTITLHLAYDGTAQRTITWTDVDRWTDNATGAAPTTPAASGNVLTVTMQYYGTTCVASATGNYAVYA